MSSRKYNQHSTLRAKTGSSDRALNAFLFAFCSLGVGCGFNANNNDLCGEIDCPSGEQCMNNVCVAVPDGGSADRPDDPLRECGGSAAFSTDFSRGLADWWLDPSPAPPRFTVDGELALTLPAGTEGDSIFVFSGPRFDLLESHWFAEVVAPEDASTVLLLVADGSPSVSRIERLASGQLRFADEIEATAIDYDPLAHRYWGLRERGGQLLFETSADGVEFVTRFSQPTPAPLDRFQVGMAIVRPAAGSEVRATFDDINGGGPATHSFCPAADRRDDFEDGMISTRLSFFDLGCGTPLEEGGVLTVVTAGNAGCTIATTNLHDLRSSEFELEHASIAAGNQPTFSAIGGFGSLRIVLIGDQLSLFDCPQEICTVAATVDFNDRLLWRFRGDGGETIAEVSADGVAYEELGRSTAFDPSAALFSIRADAGQELHLERIN